MVRAKELVGKAMLAGTDKWLQHHQGVAHEADVELEEGPDCDTRAWLWATLGFEM